MLKDDGNRFFESNKKNSIDFSAFKRIKIINFNLAIIHKTIILQFIRDFNKKFCGKYSKEDKSLFNKKVEKKINRKLTKEEFIFINERILKEVIE